MITAYKDKSEIITLPTIPEELIAEFKNTVQQLNFTEDNNKKLKIIYDFLDLYNKFVDTFSVCHNGCSACCKIGVQITKLEAQYIQDNTEYLISNNYFNKKWDCPFLVNDSCSIYNIRPFSCRTMHALDDPKYCKTNEEHHLYGAYLGKGVPMYEQLATIIQTISTEINDIRYYFQKNK